MRDHSSWSLSLGHWGGLHVRLHMTFLLAAVVAIYLGWIDSHHLGGQALSGDGMIWIAVVGLSLLLASVLLHELGHYALAVHLGGSYERMVLAPIGGLAPAKMSGPPQAELLVHLSGVAINALLSLLCMGLLVIADTRGGLLGLLHPLQPVGLLIGTAPIVALKLTFWINWLLVLVNLVPAFPLDGGSALRSALLMIWPDLGRRRAVTLVTGTTKILCIGLVVLACFLWGHSTGLLPAWFVLLLGAVLLFFAAKQEEDRQEEGESDEHLFGYDFSQGYTSLERSTHQQVVSAPTNFVTRWLEQRRARRARRKQEREAAEEQRVDEILGRLHAQGIKSLSDEDRLLLERVSARYRSRLG